MHRKFCVAVVALALLAGGCGGDKADDVKTSAERTTTTTEPTTDTTGASGLDASSATTAPSAQSAGAPSTPTSKPSGAPGATAATDPNDGPAPAATGTYDYAQSGTTSQGAVPPQGTLVVSGTGPAQVFRRNVDAEGNAADLYMNFRSDGPFLTRVVLHQGAAAISCSFGAPVPAPPWPPTTGKSFSGRATCENGFVADFSGSITGRGTDRVAGRSFDTVVIDSTLHITGNGIDVNVKDTQHWAPALRVPTYSHEVVSGTGPFGAPISGDVTSNLLNSAPR